MCYLGAISHHADRFTHQNSFQDRARVAARSEALMICIFLPQHKNT